MSTMPKRASATATSLQGRSRAGSRRALDKKAELWSENHVITMSSLSHETRAERG
jgi:hypothetical protein